MLGRISIRLQGVLSIIEGSEEINLKDPEKALRRQRAYAGGMMCDCCGKTLEELELESSMRCERCEMAFYWSPLCQR
jgi:hypothetical protein